MAAPQAAGRFKEVGEEDITRLRGILFGLIKQMQHLCWVANMNVSPRELCHPWVTKLPRGHGGHNQVSNPKEMLHLFSVIRSLLTQPFLF